MMIDVGRGSSCIDGKLSDIDAKQSDDHTKQ